MDILDKYPVSKSEFISWFINYYRYQGHTFKTFLASPFVHQCECISRFLGYKVNLNGMFPDELTEYTNNILYLYEDVKTKYPEGVPDILNQIRHMDFAERSKTFPELERPADIMHGLNEAIVPLNEKLSSVRIFISLRDAIIEIKKPVDDKSIFTSDNSFAKELLTISKDEIPF